MGTACYVWIGLKSDKALLADTGLHSEWPGFFTRQRATFRVTRFLYQAPGYVQWTCFIIKYLALLNDQTSLSRTAILSVTRLRYETLDYTQSDQPSLSDTGSHLERPVCIMRHWANSESSASLSDTRPHWEWSVCIMRHWATLRVNSLYFRH